MYDNPRLYKDFICMAKSILKIDNRNYKRYLFVIAYRDFKQKFHPYDNVYRKKMKNFKGHFFRKLRDAEKGE
jgi:hypothetical protein